MVHILKENKLLLSLLISVECGTFCGIFYGMKIFYGNSAELFFGWVFLSVIKICFAVFLSIFKVSIFMSADKLGNLVT